MKNNKLSKLSKYEKKVSESIGDIKEGAAKAIMSSDASKNALKKISSAIESDTGKVIRGSLQKYDNVKLGIYSAIGEASRGNAKQAVQKLGKAVSSITDSPSESLKNAVDGKDVLESFGVDEERSKMYGPIVEMVGPEMIASAPLKAVSTVAKGAGVSSIVNQANKALKVVDKITNGIDKASSLTGNAKLVGKTAKAIGDKAPEVKKLTDIISSATKRSVALMPKQLSENVRQSQIKGLVKKSFPMSKDANFDKVKKQIDNVSDHLTTARLDGKKVYFNDADSINEIAKQTKQQATKKSRLIIRNASDESNGMAGISGPVVYQRALDKTLAKKLPPYGKGKTQIESELKNAIGPTYEVPRYPKKISEPSKPSFESYEPELPPVMDPAQPSFKKKIGKLSNQEKKNIEILKSRGVPDDLSYAMRKDGIGGYEARQLVREGSTPEMALEASGIKNPSNDLKDVLKYEFDLNKVETENFLDSQLAKIKKSEVDARNTQKKKSYEQSLADVQAKRQAQIEDIKANPTEELPYEPDLMTAYENKSALGAQLSRAQADKTPVSAIEASRKSYSEEIADEIERVLGPEMAQKYKASESRYGLGAQTEQVAKKSFANDYELDVGQVYPSKSGIMAEAIDSARGYIPKGLELLDAPVRNSIQEIVINSGNDKELAKQKIKEFLISNPKEARTLLNEWRKGRSPQSIEEPEVIQPQKIETSDMTQVDMPKVNATDIMAPQPMDDRIQRREQELKKREFELQENVKKMRLPRNSDYLYQNKDAVKAKVSTVAPDMAGAIDYMSPEEFKNALPTFAKASPNSFEYDDYNMIDGKVHNLEKFINDIKNDSKFNSIEKAILINKAYKGDPIA